MKRSLFKYLSVPILVMQIYLVKAQIYPFEKIGLEQGIPSTRINDFFQDSRGFYWLATEGVGLVRYDGYEFKTYTNSSQAGRLFISCVTEDTDAVIWAGLENGVLSFDGYVFREYILPHKGEKVIKICPLPEGGIAVLGNRGNLWELKQGEWEEVHTGLVGKQVNDIMVLGSNYWIASMNGLYLFSEGEIKALDSNKAYALEKKNESIFAASETYVSVYNENGVPDRRIERDLKTLHSSFDMWAALTKSGNLIIRKKGDSYELSSENGLPDNNYKGCYIDHSGVVWLFSNEGLVKLESLAWRLYSKFPAEVRQVSSVYMSDEGNLYSGLSSGMAIIDREKISVLEGESGFSYGLILAMEEYENELWLGTEKGLVRKEDNIYKPVYIPGFYGLDYIFALENAQDKLWIATGSGIVAYDNGSFENISRKNELPLATVYAISSAPDGSLWFATFTEGFFRFYQGKWDVIREINGIRLDSLNFNCFTAVSYDEIWAASTEGITHFKKDKTEKLSISSIGFAEVQSLSADMRGNIWAGTNKGLIEIRNADINSVLSLSDGGGFPGIACTPKAIQVKGDELITGTVEGTQILNLKEYYEKRPVPRIALTDVKLFFGENNSLPEYARDSLPFTFLPTGLELPYTLNFLSFNIAGLTAYQKHKLIYRYRLKGQSEEWTMAGSRREAIFSDIKPGKYTFEAQVSRLGEDWSKETINYSFEILGPLYLRWWFVSGVLLISGIVIYLYVRDRINRANQRLKLENALMEMEKKALRLQMNPHFIFNALDSISSFIFKKDPQQAVRYLNNFAKLMRLTLESSMEHLHPVETEVSVLKNYLELEKLRFQGKFEYNIEIDEEIDYDVGIPPMLIQPHVENAILHGIKPKEGRGRLDVRFILEDDMLVIEIEDDGIGRRKAKELKKRNDHRSMATQINKDRLRLLRMSMGGKVNIKIRDKEDREGEPAGTKVVIRLPAEEI